MQWQDRSASNNVEDRRGQRPGGGGMRVGGVGGLILMLFVLVAGLYGIDLTPLLTDGAVVTTNSANYTPSPQDEELARFAAVDLKTTEETWEDYFKKIGRTYQPPRMVLYSGLTSTGCGYGQAAMGPFYCPSDETLYIDLSFFHDMQRKMGGGGEFAYGYVIAHEVGHHIQHLLGTDQKVRQLQSRMSQRDANKLSVMMELQADCYAGVWGRAMQEQGILDPGDVEAALRTAQAIGDDRLQKQTTGRVVPDSFTHGTSAQRYQWFKRGFESGDPKACNTFAELGNGRGLGF
ncbi:MAG: zinc metallopeptidase [Planctomycetes bacterium]|nr:zinc metallopeptidase [Planctomycetota bacterium]